MSHSVLLTQTSDNDANTSPSEQFYDLLFTVNHWPKPTHIFAEVETANEKPALRKITDKTAVKNITDPLNIWNDDAKVKLRPKYITFHGYQTIGQSELELISQWEVRTDLKLRSCHTWLE